MATAGRPVESSISWRTCWLHPFPLIFLNHRALAALDLDIANKIHRAISPLPSLY